MILNLLAAILAHHQTPIRSSKKPHSSLGMSGAEFTEMTGKVIKDAARLAKDLFLNSNGIFPKFLMMAFVLSNKKGETWWSKKHYCKSFFFPEEKGHLQLDPAHIFTVLVKDKASLPAQVLGRLSGDSMELAKGCDRLLGGFSSQSPAPEVRRHGVQQHIQAT